MTSDWFDSILALQLSTGALAWGYRTIEGDVSTGACTGICGPDWDFGSSPSLITTSTSGQLVGVGQKSGYYWALNPSTGKLVWRTPTSSPEVLVVIRFGEEPKSQSGPQMPVHAPVETSASRVR